MDNENWISFEEVVQRIAPLFDGIKTAYAEAYEKLSSRVKTYPCLAVSWPRRVVDVSPPVPNHANYAHLEQCSEAWFEAISKEWHKIPMGVNNELDLFQTCFLGWRGDLNIDVGAQNRQFIIYRGYMAGLEVEYQCLHSLYARHRYAVGRDILEQYNVALTWDYTTALAWVATQDHYNAAMAFAMSPINISQNSQNATPMHLGVLAYKLAEECTCAHIVGKPKWRTCVCLSRAWEALYPIAKARAVELGIGAAAIPELRYNILDGRVELTRPLGVEKLRFRRSEVINLWPEREPTRTELYIELVELAKESIRAGETKGQFETKVPKNPRFMGLARDTFIRPAYEEAKKWLKTDNNDRAKNAR